MIDSPTPRPTPTPRFEPREIFSSDKLLVTIIAVLCLVPTRKENECVFERQIYLPGEHFMASDNPCTNCTCVARKNVSDAQTDFVTDQMVKHSILHRSVGATVCPFPFPRWLSLTIDFVCLAQRQKKAKFFVVL